MELPEAFKIQIKKLLGEEYNAFIQALHEESPVSVRFNPLKYGHKNPFENTEKVIWASHGYYLDKRPVFTLDPLLHAGVYYVQEASSMYLEQLIRQHIDQPVRILDLCAAPGGKSTLLSAVLPENSLLVANEVIRSRAYILAENLSKWGNSNTIVTNNDPATLGKLNSFFDVIVADVPCSGEGMFRKDPASIQEWSIGNVKLCAERQRRIIADIWPALKPGGILIYSTCTYNREENENNIDWICLELGASIIEKPHRFFPHKTKGEGFFITAIKKEEDEISLHFSKGTKKTNSFCKSKTRIPEEIKSWVHNSHLFSFIEQNNLVTAFPSIHFESYEYLQKKLRIISAGISLGEIKGKSLIPDHNLALSNFFDSSSFPHLELDRENALKYLRKDTLDNELFSALPKGYIVITYENQALGFIKNIGNRTNNLYPNEWRIRMRIDKE
ncbi:rRNA cytosine-C5-methyltransferase [Bacteroidales bacterium OttesenSCG-928-M06]|nr:rRNA cytosine-C5-methyltransferase [Bacteroidales bacterium OttesenSCG-928-M06]